MSLNGDAAVGGLGRNRLVEIKCGVCDKDVSMLWWEWEEEEEECIELAGLTERLCPPWLRSEEGSG